jgi:hypothetical protein
VDAASNTLNTRFTFKVFSRFGAFNAPFFSVYNKQMQYYVPSPCNRTCTLNEDDICIGCFRSLQEIMDWTKMTPEQQQAALDLCAERKAAKKKRFNLFKR